MCEFRALRFEKTSLITVESLQKSLFIPKSLYFDKFLAEMTLDECETVDFYDFCIVFSRVVQPYLSKSMIDNIFQVINQSNTITFIFLYAYYKMCSYIFFIFSAWIYLARKNCKNKTTAKSFLRFSLHLKKLKSRGLSKNRGQKCARTENQMVFQRQTS